MKQKTLSKSVLVILLISVFFLLGIAVDLYVPSLPAIEHYFHATRHLVQFTICLYILGYALGQLFVGALSDVYGRRKLLLISAAVFTIVSGLCIVSGNVVVLIIYRLLQGMAVAGMSATCRAVVMDCFKGIEITKMMIYITTAWALGPIIGPFIGGYLQHYMGWQADFWLFSVYGLSILIYIAWRVPETHTKRLPFDMRRIGGSMWEVISHPAFLCFSLILGCIYTAFILFNLAGPFLVQVVLHYSAVDYGYAALFIGFGYFLGNVVNRWLLTRVGPDRLIMMSIIASLLVAIIMVILNVTMLMNLYSLIIPVFVIFFLAGFAFPNLMGKSLNLFPHMGGIASAMSGSLTLIVVFVLSAFATGLHTHNAMPMSLAYGVITLASLILLVLPYQMLKRRH